MESIGQTPERIGEMILVVEDSPTQAAQLRYILEKHHYSVSVAGSGSAALAMIEAKKPALIISDIVMPEMDGYELCRRIKTHDDHCDIRIILLTSLSDPQDVIRGLACGADNFITKPFVEKHLVSRVSYLLENRYELQDCAALPELKIIFAGKEFAITSSRHQILDLLLSTYEAAILKNYELIGARDELSELNDQLESANLDLKAFNAMVSHDLCQPLNNVITACQAVEILNRDKLDGQSKDLLRVAIDGVNRMGDLIRVLLRFSHSAQSELCRTMVDLGNIASDITANLGLTEPERHVTIKIAEGVMANGDPELLKVVLENLIGNAWKYTGEQSQALIEFGSTEIDGTTAYFVRDNGPGFSMAKAEEIFVPFKRLPGTTGFKGHGIGLATVERIIRRHEGKVWAEGQPGIGAAFYFTLNP
jgi:two-component system, sensor histidine kinase and response regulator